MARLSRAFGRPLMPWQRQASQLLNEHNGGRRARPFTVVTIQRQAGKTTWLLAEALERCLFAGPPGLVHRAERAVRPGEVGRAGRRAAPPRRAAAPQDRVKFTNGTERLIFPNGSTLRPFPPTKDALHSMQSDLVILDEAWKHDAVRGAELMQAIGPTQATRPGAQVVVVSTAGTADSTWLRPLVDRGRGGDPAVTYLEWGIADDVDPMDLDAVAAAHPAIGRTIDRQFLVDQAGIMAATPGEFARAYGNRWTTTLEQLTPPCGSRRHRDGTPPRPGRCWAPTSRWTGQRPRWWPATAASWRWSPTGPAPTGSPGGCSSCTPRTVPGGAGPDRPQLDAGGPAAHRGAAVPAHLRRTTPPPARSCWTASATDRAVPGRPRPGRRRRRRRRPPVGEGWAWSRRTAAAPTCPADRRVPGAWADRHRPPARSVPPCTPIAPAIYDRISGLSRSLARSGIVPARSDSLDGSAPWRAAACAAGAATRRHPGRRRSASDRHRRPVHYQAAMDAARQRRHRLNAARPGAGPVQAANLVNTARPAALNPGRGWTTSFLEGVVGPTSSACRWRTCPMTRGEAMSVPAMARARHLIAGTIAKMPLVALRAPTRWIPQPYWC